jgi:hypothetical protein
MKKKSNALTLQNVEIQPRKSLAKCTNCGEIHQVAKGFTGRYFCNEICYVQFEEKLAHGGSNND